MTALRVPRPSVLGADRFVAPAIWALTADARTTDAELRERMAAELRAPDAETDFLLETCHRVELYGAGQPPVMPATRHPGSRLLAGPEAVRHLMRVAAGLESAVVGEDQVLAQLRRASDGLRATPGDPVLHRLVQCALAVGRRVRREHRPRERGLASRALAWLAPRVDGWEGARLVVAGAGDMGTAVALAALRRGADVVVATRAPRRLPSGLDAVDLAEGARLAAAADAIVVALGGPWPALGKSGTPLPPIVDLSSPPAVPPAVRARAEIIDIDGLFDRSAGASRDDGDFVRHAEAEVEAAAAAFERWVAARPSAVAARRLSERGQRRAQARADEALRKLPNLTERERAIVRRLAVHVAADLLHEPLTRLGTDAGGRAREGARDLFDL